MKTANSTRDMQACQTAGFAAASARLKSTFAKALSSLPADGQAKLRESQRRWIAFRLSDCQVFYGQESGTMASVAGGECMIDRTVDRINNLQGFITK